MYCFIEETLVIKYVFEDLSSKDPGPMVVVYQCVEETNNHYALSIGINLALYCPFLSFVVGFFY